MRAVIVGAGMGGLMTALALRQSGVFASVDIYEQTKVPSTAGAGLNIPPNGARICSWLGVDLDGGDPKGPGGGDRRWPGGNLESTRQFNADGSRQTAGEVTATFSHGRTATAE
jgi:salicylate hydroxylase